MKGLGKATLSSIPPGRKKEVIWEEKKKDGAQNKGKVFGTIPNNPGKT